VLNQFLQLIVPSLVMGSQTAVLALGFAIAYWPSRQVNFAFGGMYVISAYLTWEFNKAGLALIIATAVVAVIVIVLQVSIPVLLYNPIKSETSVFLASFGVFILIEYVVEAVFSANPLFFQVPSGQLTQTSLGLFGGASQLDVISVVIGVVAFLAVWLFLKRTRPGKQVRAIVADPFMAEAAGVSIRSTTMICYAIGGVLVTVAGVFAAYRYGLTPTIGETPVFYALNATLVGGRGNILGAGVAGFAIGVVVTLCSVIIPTQWAEALAFGLLFVALVIRPSGLFRSLAWT
jgi:branched-chain amino acid transport system permease protein